MYIKTFMRDEIDEKLHLIYDKTTKKLTLQTIVSREIERFLCSVIFLHY